VRAIATALLLAACATLPATQIPVCSDDPGVACRPPAPDWVVGKLCPDEIDLQYRSCYLRAGHRESRDLYVYVVFR
jgi:hypothetical protein